MQPTGNSDIAPKARHHPGEKAPENASTFSPFNGELAAANS